MRSEESRVYSSMMESARYVGRHPVRGGESRSQQQVGGGGKHGCRVGIDKGPLSNAHHSPRWWGVSTGVGEESDHPGGTNEEEPTLECFRSYRCTALP